MSLDYPFYEELRRRDHRAAGWWLVGDRLYYLGLLTTAVAALMVPVGLAFGFGDGDWRLAVRSGLLLPAGVGVFVLGGWLKGRSYRLAERDGIDPGRY